MIVREGNAADMAVNTNTGLIFSCKHLINLEFRLFVRYEHVNNLNEIGIRGMFPYSIKNYFVYDN